MYVVDESLSCSSKTNILLFINYIPIEIFKCTMEEGKVYTGPTGSNKSKHPLENK